MSRKHPERRKKEAIARVPFVRRCSLDVGQPAQLVAYVVNISTTGAYLTLDDVSGPAGRPLAKPEPPPLGQPVRFTFAPPGSEHVVTAYGVVTWVNTRQQHPVHSLPPGFGVRFLEITDEDRRRIERIVENWIATHPEVTER